MFCWRTISYLSDVHDSRQLHFSISTFKLFVTLSTHSMSCRPQSLVSDFPGKTWNSFESRKVKKWPQTQQIERNAVTLISECKALAFVFAILSRVNLEKFQHFLVFEEAVAALDTRFHEIIADGNLLRENVQNCVEEKVVEIVDGEGRLARKFVRRMNDEVATNPWFRRVNTIPFVETKVRIIVDRW